MNKKSVVPTLAIHPAQSDPSPARRNTEVSAQITLSDSILTGAVVEYRKAGYRFIRHMHKDRSVRCGRLFHYPLQRRQHLFCPLHMHR